MREIFIGIIIVSTIIYLVFSIRNTFIKKKQTRISIVDILFYLFFAGWTVTFECSFIAMCIEFAFLVAWIVIVSDKWGENYIASIKKDES